MLIDMILDRRASERIGESYCAADFYRSMSEYMSDFPEIMEPILRAFDLGTEEDAKLALCRYIVEQDYNPLLCGWVCSRKWTEDESFEETARMTELEKIRVMWDYDIISMEEYDKRVHAFLEKRQRECERKQQKMRKGVGADDGV